MAFSLVADEWNGRSVAGAKATVERANTDVKAKRANLMVKTSLWMEFAGILNVTSLQSKHV